MCILCRSTKKKTRGNFEIYTFNHYFLVCFSEVDRLLSCIGKSLEDQHCGPEAITLKDKLARTLIRGSQGCDKVSLP